MDVELWLRALGLDRYAQAFADNDIDAETLRQLNADDLKDIGVASVGHRKRLLAAIAELSAEPSEPAPPDGERRQVTVLFADLADFTRLSAELGPEETHALLNRYFEAVDGIVEGYGGAIDKHIGDNVMAVFGAPLAHSDDPERAARAALEVHQAMRGLSERAGRPLHAHLGIASGPVVASGTGSEAHREYTVTGDAVNLAARLQDMAGAEETLISDPVHRALSGLADCAALGEVEVKGFADAVPVWRLDGLGTEVAAAERTAFVGRRAELRQFEALVEDCLDAGLGHAVLVRGEAGIGKTRLVAEFATRAQARDFTLHKALVLDFGVGKGQDAIRTLVRSLLGIPAGSGEGRRQAVADAAIEEGLLAEDDRVFVNDLLDLPQPVALRGLYDAMDNPTRNRGKRAAVSALVRVSSEKAPRLITVEDIHWADPLTLDHLAALAETVADCRALLVMSTRIEGDPLDQAWRSAIRGSPLATVDLAPLRAAEAAALAGGMVEASEGLIARCIARAEGNPLFLEQLLLNAEEGQDDAVPGSIQGLVLARIDRLAAKDKEAVQAAAVTGQHFTLESLRHLLNDPRYDCKALIDQFLIRPEGEHYLFAHALIQEGVYASLLKARQRGLHQKAAEWFAERDPIVHAEHLERAEDEGAPQAYLEAARVETRSFRLERALRLVHRGLELAQSDTDRFALSCRKGELLHDLGLAAESVEAYRHGLDTAGDDVERCRAWIGLAAGMRVTDRYDEAFLVLGQAENVAVEHHLAADLARLHHLRGNLYFPIGKTEDCLREHRSALKYAEASHSSENEARALSGLGDAEYARGRLLTAYDYFRRCLEICREHGFGRIEVANVAQVAHIQHYFKEMPDVLADTLKAIESAARVGHHRAEVVARLTAVDDLFDLGEMAQATEHLDRVQAVEEILGAKRYEGRRLTYAAQIVRAEGSHSEALDLLERAIKSCHETGMSYFGPVALGELALTTNDLEVREKSLEEGERILHSGSMSRNHFWFYRAAMEIGRIEGNWEKVDRYASALEDYTRAEPLPWTDLFIARGRALAAFGRGARDEATMRELKRLRDEAARVGLKSALPALQEALASA